MVLAINQLVHSLYSIPAYFTPKVPPVIDTILKRSDALLVINLSGGKDSYAMLRYLVRLHTQRGYQAKIVAVHANLGLAEWEGTEAITRAQCDDVGLPLTVWKKSGKRLVAAART